MAVPNWQSMPSWQVVVATSIVATSVAVLRDRNTLAEQGREDNGTTPPSAAGVIRHGKACADPPPVRSPGSYCVDAIPHRVAPLRSPPLVSSIRHAPPVAMPCRRPRAPHGGQRLRHPSWQLVAFAKCPAETIPPRSPGKLRFRTNSDSCP